MSRSVRCHRCRYFCADDRVAVGPRVRRLSQTSGRPRRPAARVPIIHRQRLFPCTPETI